MPEPRLPFMAVSPNLRTNRKFVRLRRLLGNPSERDLVGSLVMLWSQVFNESPSGDVSTWTDDEIADCAGWEDGDVRGTSQGRPGTNGTFRGALEAARFIVAGRIHDWDEWGGYLYQVRASEAERKRAYREQQERDRKGNEAGTAKPVPGTSADVPVMSTLTNGTEPTELRIGGAVPAPVVPTASPKPPRSKTKFAPPSVDEVRTEVKRRGSLVDPEAFVAHYQASGWKLKGGQPVVDWKACLTTWEKNRGRFGDNGSRPTSGSIRRISPELSPEERRARDAEYARKLEEGRRALAEQERLAAQQLVLSTDDDHHEDPS